MNVREIRRLVGQSQAEYASGRGIPVGTLRNWEQGVSNPPEYLVRLLEEQAMHSMEINWGTLKLMQALDELVEKTKAGFISFDDAEDEHLEELVLVDRGSEDDDGCPIVWGYVVDEFHHDIVCHYGCNLRDVVIRAACVADEEFIVVKSLVSNDEIVIEDGRWYFA